MSSSPVPLQPVDGKLFGVMEQLHQQVCDAAPKEGEEEESW